MAPNISLCLLFLLSLLSIIHAQFSFDFWSILGQSRSKSGSKPGSKDEDDEDMESLVYLWPMPAQVSRGSFTIEVDPSLELLMMGGYSPTIAKAFQRYKSIIFTHHSAPLPRYSIIQQPCLQRLVVNVLSHDDTLQLGTDESYHLVVPGEGNKFEAYLEANSIYGALRGLETFSQLCFFDFLTKRVEIFNATWDIWDTPRFSYRGLLIDTSRHYQPIHVIKDVIDSMVYAKLNVLHWHVVDEQAFPLEIPSYPLLWNGAYTGLERYTLDDAREIVEYAKERGINVMAEIDVPGHARSWGYGYSELWPSHDCHEPLDVSKNFTFSVIEGILADLREVFPFGLFHLGGDEVDTGCWTNNDRIKMWLQDNQMTGHDAYKYFVLRAQKLALSYGWEPVNWEETFTEFAESLHPKTIVHNWLGPGVASQVVAKGFRCIVSNQDVWYLDHMNITWENFYLNEPLEGFNDTLQQELVLGGQVCMWGETVDASDILQTIWPRAAAAAERLWSPRTFTDKGTKAALRRLEFFRCVLNQRNVAAAPVENKYARKAPSGPGSCFIQ